MLALAHGQSHIYGGGKAHISRLVLPLYSGVTKPLAERTLHRSDAKKPIRPAPPHRDRSVPHHDRSQFPLPPTHLFFYLIYQKKLI
jgi:hypothetical protein